MLDSKQSTTPHELENVSTLGDEKGVELPHDPLEESPDEDYVLTRRTIITVLALSMGYAAQTAQLTTSTTIAHQVAAVGGGQDASWIANAQNVVTFGTTACIGSISDHFGKRNFILAGLLIGMTGCLIASRADHIGQIIAGQGLLGISGSFCNLVNPAVQEIVPSKSRPWTTISFLAFLVVFNMICTLAFAACIKYDVTGANNGWRFTYYLPAIFAFIGFIAVAVTYFPPPPRMHRGKSNMTVLKELDYLGMFTLLSGATLVIVGLNWGGSSYPWVSAEVLGTICSGAVCLVVFIWWNWKGTSEGLLTHRLFSLSRNFALILAVSFCDGMILFGASAYLPQEVAAIFTTDPIKQSLPLVFSSITQSLGGMVAAWVLFRYKSYRIFLGVGCLWLAAWTGAMGAIRPGAGWMPYVFSLFYAIGLGSTTALPNLIMAYSVPSDLLGTALTITQTARTFGGVIGITIFSSVLNNKKTLAYTSLVVPAAIKAGLPSMQAGSLVGALEEGLTGNALLSIRGMTPTILSAIDYPLKLGYADSYRWVWFAVAPFCVFAALMTPFMIEVRSRMTGHVEAKIERQATRQT